MDWIGSRPLDENWERELNLTFPAGADLHQSLLGLAKKETRERGGSGNVKLGASDTRRRVIAALGHRRGASTPSPLPDPLRWNYTKPWLPQVARFTSETPPVPVVHLSPMMLCQTRTFLPEIAVSCPSLIQCPGVHYYTA